MKKLLTKEKIEEETEALKETVANARKEMELNIQAYHKFYNYSEMQFWSAEKLYAYMGPDERELLYDRYKDAVKAYERFLEVIS